MRIKLILLFLLIPTLVFADNRFGYNKGKSRKTSAEQTSSIVSSNVFKVTAGSDIFVVEIVSNDRLKVTGAVNKTYKTVEDMQDRLDDFLVAHPEVLLPINGFYYENINYGKWHNSLNHLLYHLCEDIETWILERELPLPQPLP